MQAPTAFAEIMCAMGSAAAVRLRLVPTSAVSMNESSRFLAIMRFSEVGVSASGDEAEQARGRALLGGERARHVSVDHAQPHRKDPGQRRDAREGVGVARVLRAAVPELVTGHVESAHAAADLADRALIVDLRDHDSLFDVAVNGERNATIDEHGLTAVNV